ncbi:MAG: SDR family NAD(P)-dependent oxidoreductase [Candidatus Borkfalkiaceae bacterium]|nr:SDR family NAD(P)-dependent oxidoreductase [Clostridia bacterium]MDY6223263.1 SDR family NAD(P)-dependent oxidoreductase [Christensenellaceae bacterium]
MENTCVILTGATGGLGKAFAEELILKKEIADGERSLVLTGRSEEKLALLKSDLLLRAPNAEIYTKSADMSLEESRNEFFSALESRGEKVSLLINAAGADIQKPFETYTQKKLLFQCRANFEGAAAMSLYAVQNAAAGAKIINISSVSGIYPMPYFAVYSAMKGALTSFSLALRKEVKKRGIGVTVILPGAMPTREDIREQIRGQKLWGKLAAEPPSVVAKAALRAAEKNRAKVIAGFWNKAMNACTKLIPLSLKMKFIEKRWSKISKDAF